MRPVDDAFYALARECHELSLTGKKELDVASGWAYRVLDKAHRHRGHEDRPCRSAPVGILQILGRAGGDDVADDHAELSVA